MDLYTLGLVLIFVGIITVVVAAILIAARGSRGNTKSAGVIIIGPVPIVVGDKQATKPLLILATVLTALLIVGMVLYYLLFR